MTDSFFNILLEHPYIKIMLFGIDNVYRKIFFKTSKQ